MPPWSYNDYTQLVTDIFDERFANVGFEFPPTLDDDLGRCYGQGLAPRSAVEELLKRWEREGVA